MTKTDKIKKAPNLKKRLLICKQCSSESRGDYAKHQSRCEAKHGGKWKGWIYHAMDGVTVIQEKDLPKRDLRGTDININAESYVPNKKEVCPLAEGWSYLRRNKWTCTRKQRHAGLEYVLRKCIQNGGLKKE